jgi:hypothetical protein
LAKHGKGGPYGAGELLSAGSWPHALSGADKQRILKTGAQPAHCIAERRLAEPYSPRSAANMPLVHERLEGEQKVQVNSGDIHELNNDYEINPFYK